MVAPFWDGSIGGRPSFVESHQTTWADTTGAGRPNAGILKGCGASANAWCVPGALDKERVELVPTRTWPLVVMLAGRGDTPIHVMTNTYTAMRTINEDMGAIVVGVTGKTSTAGGNSWNAGVTCCYPDASPPDDDAWIDQMISNVIAAGWPVDPKRIYVWGHSAGSAMAFRYACNHPDRVAAIFSMSTFAIRTDLEAACAAGHFSAVHFHGTADSVLYDNNVGASLSPQTTEYVSVEVDRFAPTRMSTTSQLIAQNGCSGGLSTTTAGWLDFDSLVGGAETDLKQVSGCPTDGAVEVWKANGTAHVPTMTAAGKDAMVAWLLAHPKP